MKVSLITSEIVAMKETVFVLAAFGARAQPAFAETTWEKLEHGIDVVKDCAGAL